MAFANRHHALITALCFAAGLVVAYHALPFFSEAGLRLVWGLTFFCFVGGFFFLKKTFYPLALVFFFVSGLAIGFNALALFPENHLLFQPWRKADGLKGHIVSATYKAQGSHRYVLQCEAIHVDSQFVPAQGRVLLFQKAGGKALRYGQPVVIYTKLQQPPLPDNPGAFNFRRYLNFQGIFFQGAFSEGQVHVLGAPEGHGFRRMLIDPLQRRVRQIITHHVPPETAPLIQALILGERQNLDRQTYRQFQKIGVVHVLAISGLHVGFVLLVFVLFFGLFPISYRLRFVLAFGCLALFVALVNFKAPVVRASLMAVLYFGLKELQRQASGLNILGLAAFLILLIDPGQLFQPGFQFSFAAVGGILIGFPRLKPAFTLKAQHAFASVVNRWLLQPLLVSLTAVLGTLPLTWWYYGTLQTGAVLFNLIVIPLMGLLVVFSLMLVLLGLISFPFLAGLGWTIHVLFKALKHMIAVWAKWPLVQLQVGHPSPLLVLVAAITVFYLLQASLPRAKLKALIAGSVLVLLLSFKPEQPLRVTFINVKQGDACLVQFPKGEAMLVDGGEARPWLQAGERLVVPLLDYFAIKRLKYVVATHAHTDHFGGLSAVLTHCTVDTLVISTYPDRSERFVEFLKQAVQKGIAVKAVHRGERLYPASNVRCYVLHPFGAFQKVHQGKGREVNNSSVVLKLCYGQTSFLLTGDAQKSAEQALETYGDWLRATVLKAGHHGSITSCTEPFLNLVSPEFTVISVGRGNKFGHPSPVILQRLQERGVPVLRTDRLGAIMFESDGSQVQVINWRRWWQ